MPVHTVHAPVERVPYLVYMHACLANGKSYIGVMWQLDLEIIVCKEDRQRNPLWRKKTEIYTNIIIKSL